MNKISDVSKFNLDSLWYIYFKGYDFCNQKEDVLLSKNFIIDKSDHPKIQALWDSLKKKRETINESIIEKANEMLYKPGGMRNQIIVLHLENKDFTEEYRFMD